MKNQTTLSEICHRRFNSSSHRVNREDSPIIILDTTTLVPDFDLHARYFLIAGNRPALKLPHSSNKSLSYENCSAKSLLISDPDSEIFFFITYEISKLGSFIYFIYCLSPFYLFIYLYIYLYIYLLSK